MQNKEPAICEVAALAQRLYEEAKAKGTLKEPRGLIAIALSNGYTKSIGSPVTAQDYFPEARAILAGAGRPPTKRKPRNRKRP